jgi:hypothetical protein
MRIHVLVPGPSETIDLADFEPSEQSRIAVQVAGSGGEHTVWSWSRTIETAGQSRQNLWHFANTQTEQMVEDLCPEDALFSYLVSKYRASLWGLVVVDEASDVVDPQFVDDVVYRANWDQALVFGSEPQVELMLQIAAALLAQWEATRAALDRTRTLIRRTEDSVQKIGAAVVELEALYDDLNRASVLYDQRDRVFWAFEHEFLKALRACWGLEDLDALSRQAVSAVDSVLHRELARIAGIRSERQQRLSSRSNFLLFVLSVVSGSSAVFAAIDFVGNRTEMSLGSLSRTVFGLVVSGIAVVTAVRFRRLADSNEADDRRAMALTPSQRHKGSALRRPAQYGDT